MNTTVQALQRRLIALGFQLPKSGADGDFGIESIIATGNALDELQSLRAFSSMYSPPATPVTPQAFVKSQTVPADWMPPAKMVRIICHWTAGAHKASEFDRGHYHILIEDDGKLIRGGPSIDLNQSPTKKGYAAHTLNCNSGSIGVSLCCMGGSNEAPFDPGKYPMTRKQWDALTSVVADLCRRYNIKITDKTVLSHAEVQNNLGIQQRGKWDFTRLAFDPSIKGAKACGDKLRAEASAKL
ncbi:MULTISPECIES: peptidoglycan recognition family protein [Ensifer]|uniref:N-acetylmuramoyl-L-alanine amidase n=1 Tax=Ensifer canadensis TaxID=555315 RepID=A0AAW4FKJ5_9HYPH|nr:MULTISPECIES: peptidoglycan recognition family protein [Ensifer]KQW62690.1 N-acetylmuramoyl-L-alanine amidase [Ensifer sp. Root1252]KRC83510.1 N-acetylmuramoyl-L-alanine amidase [Ensifer sp. Root231]KRC86584.1 N-acetylmuramoyl-L-alanine amidase [Ensifer sp. Root258]MBM3091621.1 N-acetylmuramoyl-L-alanine amidase [Ensifer canadensis]UBI74393.1 N-acetylmuramoyl-L-alanine amidase [Ensifer canadensis]